MIPLEKVVRLGKLARQISAAILCLGEALALRGGTALNLCFGPPGRLSVDLDYNYVAHVEREKMLADRPRIETAVAELARRRGYIIQQSADAFAGRKTHLRYRSVLGLLPIMKNRSFLDECRDQNARFGRFQGLVSRVDALKGQR